MTNTPFTEEQIIWLKENIKLEVNKHYGHYSDSWYTVKLYLAGEEISYNTIEADKGTY